MSYAKRVEIQRKRNRVIEERRKAKEGRATVSGSKRGPQYQPLKAGEKSFARRFYEALTSWKSKKTLKAEAEAAERKAREEAKKAADAKA